MLLFATIEIYIDNLIVILKQFTFYQHDVKRQTRLGIIPQPFPTNSQGVVLFDVVLIVIKAAFWCLLQVHRPTDLLVLANEKHVFPKDLIGMS